MKEVLLIRSVKCDVVPYSGDYMQVINDKYIPHIDINMFHDSCLSNIETMKVKELNKIDKFGNKTTTYFAITKQAKDDLSVVFESYEAEIDGLKRKVFIYKHGEQTALAKIDVLESRQYWFNKLPFFKKIWFILRGERI